ncbi:MSEP-CTERM sorting domain-containing protein [Microscilla marina]|uniref:Membrane protein, putative n=1 Tax=Microscilla marina ATCC 23134 TaxID=313606 RepID=A1ZPE6_MICM2|nr:MSEP-CTERM sorting domain-containing protein [Microscilla marina]EAY27685.1 membrane protein, putative [Microscilla marina ATCC 23134]
MKNLIKPYWILLTVTLPQLLLFGLYSSSFSIIKSLLSPQNLYYWQAYGLILGSAWGLATCYSVWATIRKKNINAYFSFIALSFYVPILYFFLADQHKIIPGSVPNWMLSTSDLPLYVLTFLMPAIFHSVLRLVVFFTPGNTQHPNWWNFGLVVAIPVSWYLLFTIVLPAINQGGINKPLFQHIMLLIFACSTVVFFFFLIRGVYSVSITRKNFLSGQYQLLWQIPVFVIFPVAGLYLNQDLGMVFGNFAEPVFYGLAMANGLLMLIPEKKIGNDIIRLALFTARSITFSYILYFFWVFLPLLPFSIIAILIIGAGFLMLTPVLITILQANTLRLSFIHLSARFSPAIVIVCLLGGLTVLPLWVTQSYRQDRKQLHEALALVYAPNISESAHQLTNINPNRIKRVLKNVHKNKGRTSQNGFGFGFDAKQKPYLSTFYKYIVLDNLTLSNKKIRALHKIFLGTNVKQSDHTRTRRFVVGPSHSDQVTIDSVQVKSSFDAAHQYWRTWVHLDIQNATKRQQEYRTKFTLPAGTWISNYYLMMEGRKEYGILAEKKAAMWVYNNIVSRRRDPGLLHYTEGNQVSFKVFPFAPEQTRKTGIEFVHKEPVQLTIGKHTLTLGDSSQQKSLTQAISTHQGVYVSALTKQQAPAKVLKPYLHFVVDLSAQAVKDKAMYVQRIREYLKKYPQHKAGAKITFGNFAYKSIALNEQSRWEQQLHDFPVQGGFFIESMFKRLFVQPAPKGTYPVAVLVSDHLDKAVFEHAMAGFAHQLQGSRYFYALKPDHTLSSYSLLHAPLKKVKANAAIPANKKVREINTLSGMLLVADNDQASFYTLPKGGKGVPQISKNAWNNGAELWSFWQYYLLHPNDRPQYKAFVHRNNIIKGSFQAHIMSPVTSFIAVENEAQKAALKAKQEQILKGNHLLDAGEELQAMSEPELWWLLGILGVFFGWKQWQRKQKMQSGLHQ